MSEEEKKQYIEKKHAEDTQKRKEMAEIAKTVSYLYYFEFTRAMYNNFYFYLLNQKYEDLEISTQLVLPKPTITKLPDSFSASDFGDILMISDFVIGYRDLLSPVEKFSINSGNLNFLFKLTQVRCFRIIGLFQCLL